MGDAPANSTSDAESPRTLTLLGTPLCLTTYEEFSAHCRKLARRPNTSAVDFSNTQIVTMRRHDEAFRTATDGTDYFVPDGMPLIWCLNLGGAQLKDRVYGPTFMRQLVTNLAAESTHFFLGGSEECVRRLQEGFLRQNPQVRILGARHGYFPREEEPAIVEEINRLSPDFIWVGLGTPRQQQWIQRHRHVIRRGILFAVGFAFDVNAGTKRDAPPWMQRAGLTWLFRLASEPRRLTTRYLRYNSLFVYYLLLDSLRGRAFGSGQGRAARKA